MNKSDFVLVVFLAAFASAETNNLDFELEETPRLGVINITDPNTLATLYEVIIVIVIGSVVALVVLVVALAVLPLLGVDLTTLLTRREDFGQTNYNYLPYDPSQSYSTYGNFAKRSFDLLSPVLKALSNAYQKYE